MKARWLVTVLGVVGLGTLSFVHLPARGDDAGKAPADTQEGVEVLAYGPVHEAYAQPVNVNPKAPAVVAKKPPEPLREGVPDQKPELDGVQWIAGYWAWDEDKDDYMWVSGIWRVPPPNRQWAAGYWVEADNGFQWTPGFWAQAKAKGELEEKFLPQPPALPKDATVPPQPNPTASFVPGTYVYNNNAYAWRDGFWMDYRPGWVWNPGSFSWTTRGYTWNTGYWDYAPANRGMLFSPVRIANQSLTRNNFVYNPRWVVHHENLWNSFFVRHGWRHYAFGDYFSNRWRQAGYLPWHEHRFWGHWGDPLFNFNHALHHAESNWLHNLENHYHGVYNGTIPHPARTLALQNRLGPGFRNAALLTALHDVHRLGVRTHNLSQRERADEARMARMHHQISKLRHEVEGKKPANGANSAKMNLPGGTKVVKGEGAHKPPDNPKPPAPQTAKNQPLTKPFIANNSKSNNSGAASNKSKSPNNGKSGQTGKKTPKGNATNKQGAKAGQGPARLKPKVANAKQGPKKSQGGKQGASKKPNAGKPGGKGNAKAGGKKGAGRPHAAAHKGKGKGKPANKATAKKGGKGKGHAKAGHRGHPKAHAKKGGGKKSKGHAHGHSKGHAHAHHGKHK